MSEIITVKKKNECDFTVLADYGVQMEMHDQFKFFVKNAQHMPAFKQKRWDGFIRMYDLKTKSIPIGLYDDIVSFCKERNYHLEFESSPYGLPNETENITLEEVKEYVDSLQCSDKHGNILEIREYQYQAVFEAIKNRRMVILASTGSGKSLIQYIIIRWMLDMEAAGLMIVPTKQLVLQMLKDFVEYSTVNGFNVDDAVHIIMGGHEKKTKKPVVISTWQSLTKLPPVWFQRFDLVMCDEVHLAKGQSIQTILGKCTEARWRYGLTGSLDDSLTNVKMIQACFGKVIRMTSTRKLMDDGHLTDIDIKCILLDYSNETKLLCKDFDYQREIDFLCQHDRRNKFIAKLALSLDGNTLVLYNYVEKHGQLIYDLIKKRADPEREIFFIHGDVDAVIRDDVREKIESLNDSVTVASMGTFSTGTNVKRIHNVIFASPSKSVIRVLQSIGRGLRLAGDKTVFNLYDLADNLARSKKKKNYTYNHFVERLNIYHSESFNFKIIDVPIE